MIVSADTTQDTNRLELIEIISINRTMITNHIATFESIFAFKCAASPPRRAQIGESIVTVVSVCFRGGETPLAAALAARDRSRAADAACGHRDDAARERRRVREEMRGIVGRPSA
ncbi:hypothetical protein ACQR0V_14140 [Bradyrhizobium sp. HKCCYLS2058]|uniref:hypothetical protein n=1 Tax=unclassified Bradyrhizobium TaxID=2631580 RepID=UPI003EB820BE